MSACWTHRCTKTAGLNWVRTGLDWFNCWAFQHHDLLLGSLVAFVCQLFCNTNVWTFWNMPVFVKQSNVNILEHVSICETIKCEQMWRWNFYTSDCRCNTEVQSPKCCMLLSVVNACCCDVDKHHVAGELSVILNVNIRHILKYSYK